MVVFLLEERSMESFLKGILPQIIMNEEYRLIPHEGKGDLLKSIPNKLKGWSIPNTKFVIIYDQDSNDCIDLKKQVLVNFTRFVHKFIRLKSPFNSFPSIRKTLLVVCATIETHEH